jgi:catalase
LLGVHSVAWDEAQKISGKDPDFHRRDLWTAIENGDFPEWELGIQVIPEADEHKFEFDLLDPTKLIPEELVPVQRVGKMTLNRNPDNFFAETEQVAFHVGNIVPGIDFTNDPLMQGRLFSYMDTQLIRLGGPNFHEIPINRPIVQVHNNQRDGHMRQQINRGKTSYSPNSLGGGCPFQAKMSEGGFTSYSERIDSKKIRERSASFFDHFSQAKLFFNSQSDAEKNHIVDALSFELGKCETEAIRERMLGILSKIDKGLAAEVAYNLGLHVPNPPEQPMNHSIPADADPKNFQPKHVESSLQRSEALSMVNTVKDTIRTRKIAILAADGVDEKSLLTVKEMLEAEGATAEIVAPKLGKIMAEGNTEIQVKQTFFTTASVLYDAVYVPGGISAATLAGEPDAVHFLNEAYKHCKAIAADAAAMPLLQETYFYKKLPEDRNKETALSEGIIIHDDLNKLSSLFIDAIAQHRFWDREKPKKVPA